MKPTDSDNKLGDYVRHQRLARGLSGQALAAAAGVDKAWLHRLESGKYESPDPRLLLALARSLEVDATDLFTLAGFAPGTDLPSIEPYLRAKFDLPEQAVQQITEYVDLLNKRYGRKEADDDTDAAA